MEYLRKYTSLIIVLISALLFIPFLGRVHLFDWDEVNFAECAREMLITKEYLIVQMNFSPFWEKPPLFIWLSALSMKVFGVSEMAARFPNALCGIITLLILFHIGKKHYSRSIGLLWVLCYAGSTLPLFYFKSGIIDPWFNLFVFLGIYFFVLFTYDKKDTNKARLSHLLLSALFVGLAILTKGPAAGVIFGLCFGVYLLMSKFRRVVNVKEFVILVAAILLVGGFWFIFLLSSGQSRVVETFISYQVHLFQTEDSGHGGPFVFHFIVLLIGCFPASTFALRGFAKPGEVTSFQKHMRTWMLILFWVVLLLFSIVKTKIVHYSSLCYFPLTFLAANVIVQAIKEPGIWKKWMSVVLVITGGLFALALAMLPLVDRYKSQIINSDLIADEFTKGNLSADVSWSGWESMLGVLLLCGIIFALILKTKGRMWPAVLTLFLSNIFVVELFLLIVVPKIEVYTQAAAIEFYKAHQKDGYVCALGYHSYAQYYYSSRQPETDPERNSNDWMLRGKIDKDAFFVAKVDNAHDHANQNPELIQIGSKNGYVFFQRKAILDTAKSE